MIEQFLSDCERVSTNYALKQLKHSKNGLVFLAWYVHPEALPAKFRSGLSPKEVFKNTREELMHEARKVCQGKDNDMFNYYRYGPEVMHIQRRSSFSKLPRTNSQSSIFDLESKSESVYLASLFDLDKDKEQSLLYLKALRDNILSTLETVYGVTSEDKIKIYFHALYAERTTTLHAHIRVNQADHPLEDAKSFGINEIISTLEKGGSVTEMILRRGTIYYTQFSLDKDIEGVCIKIIPNFKRDWYDIFDSLGASNIMTTYLLQAIKYNEVKNRIQLLDIDQIEKLLRIIKIDKTFPEIENLVNILKTLEPNRELRKLGWSMETGTCSDLVMNVTVNPNKHFMSENGNGKLRLYHLFPRNYALMADVIADLDRIGQLGFNAIWISPLSASSDLIINRFNI
ncbi:hypothetical protein, partial [Rickettsiella massiliensis]|uniref:hypothetical protein n=1 Tax=Rickettsiella massiliensis TaxID=676517 RepID=UPI00029A5AEE